MSSTEPTITKNRHITLKEIKDPTTYLELPSVTLKGDPKAKAECTCLEQHTLSFSLMGSSKAAQSFPENCSMIKGNQGSFIVS